MSGVSAFDPLRTLAHLSPDLHQLLQQTGRVVVAGAMPRYFLDLYNDIDTFDEEGVDLSDVDGALAHALCEARHMIQASVADRGRIDLRHHIDIRDEHGTHPKQTLQTERARRKPPGARRRASPCLPSA